MLAILRQRNFGLLWVGQLISVFGDWVLLVALPFHVFNLTGSTLATGGMFIAQTVPRVFFGSFAGVFVDRWDRKRTMIAADVVRGLLLLLLLAVRSVDWLWIVYIVAFAQSLIGQFFLPAKNAVIPALVSADDLVPANSLNSLSENLTRLTAPAIGGAMFGVFGLTSVVFVDSASFLLSGLLIALIVFPPSARRVATAVQATSVRAVWNDWRDGMRLMRHDPLITAIFATAGTAMIAEGIFLVILVPFVKEVLHGGAQSLGWLASTQAIGGLVGSLFISRVGKAIRPAMLIPVSGLLFGLGDISVANLPGHTAFPALWTACAMIALAGVPIVGFFVGLTALLQGSVTNEFRGRIFGAFGTVQALLTLCGQALGGVLGERVSPVTMLTIAGGFDILAGLVAFVLLRRVSHVATPSCSAREEVATSS